MIFIIMACILLILTFFFSGLVLGLLDGNDEDYIYSVGKPKWNDKYGKTVNYTKKILFFVVNIFRYPAMFGEKIGKTINDMFISN